MTIPGTSLAETCLQTQLGRIFEQAEWQSFKTYYFRHFAKDGETIARGIDEAMPSHIHILTDKPITARRLKALQDILHAFHNGYEFAIANRTK